MARDADYRFDHIVRTVDDVCRDLEARCNEVEQPLREQRAHCEDLKTQLIALQGSLVVHSNYAFTLPFSTQG